MAVKKAEAVHCRPVEQEIPHHQPSLLMIYKPIPAVRILCCESAQISKANVDLNRQVS